MPSVFEWFIIVAIIGGIAFVGVFQARRSGQNNPVSTGRLEREMRQLAAKVNEVGGDVADLKGGVKALGAKVDQVERDSVRLDDIAQLKELIEAKHDARFAMMSGMMTDLDIIKRWLMEKGLGGR
ncbi:hypothetical protein [Sphingobium yanoikuyae]|uniref:Uncharacterized protein n=1 Tax=Sphingobium yanoikuyae TaxID=13690 RepID=A0A430BWR1_SPHYA|nr:hypothetical protein [Sphingobium yanoikuyae]RSU57208.1 hypothetical protein DAH51_10370 [Sphingobium yanoikuyae]